MNFKEIIILIILMSCKMWGQSTNWESIGEMPIPVYGGEAVTSDSVIYILGGYSDSSGSATDLIQSFNPNTNKWKIVGRMNESRVGFVAVKFKDEIVVYGGLPEGDSTSAVLEKIVIKPDTILFIKDTTLKENRLYSSGVIKDSTLIIIGGNTDLTRANSPDSSSYIFTYRLDGKSTPVNIDSTFPVSSNVPYQQMCTVYDNAIYVFGGLYLGVSSWIYEFNFINSEFMKKVINLSEPRAGGRAIPGNNGDIYLIGGYNEISLSNNTSLKTVEIFNVYSEKLQQGLLLTYPRKEFMAAKFGEYIYIFGGKGVNDSIVRKCERYKIIEITSSSEQMIKVAEFRLNDCYPNPFNPSTNITFSIPKSTNITLEVFSILGEKIKTLASGYYTAGMHKVIWDGRDANGSTAASGLYFYRLSVGINSFTKKAILLK